MNDILFSSWGGRIVDNRGKEPPAYESVNHVRLPEYFKQDQEIKALIGWDGIILRSREVNIVDLCLAYMKVVSEHAKSCDKCNYCKTGYTEMAEVLNDICSGNAQEEDIEFLKTVAEAIMGNAKCTIGKSGPVPLLHALQYFADGFSQLISNGNTVTAGTYYSRLTAPCMDACPIHLDIPRYVELIKEAKFAGSLDVIRERLPLSGVVGRVCVRPCEKNCRRANADEPISIMSLKRFVADHELSMDKEPDYQIIPSGKTGKVAIVGAGPAGITCAYHLALKGHQVTIYESLGEPGGMAAVGIPDYRLPRHILHTEVERVRKMDVTIHYNHKVGKDVTLPQLENEFDAVFVAIGAHNSASMGIEGEREGYKGFVHGLEYLREINEGRDPYPEGRKVVVIGGGNTAVDCARCSVRINKEEVLLVYRRTRNEMPAVDSEIHDVGEENVQFHFLTTPIRILAEDGKVAGLECIRMKLGEPDESGRPRPVPIEGSEFVIDCDTIVPAIGQRVDLSLFEGMQDIQITKWGNIIVDKVIKQSSRPKIFAAGDCETGPDALITACAGGRKAAYSIDRFINDLPLEYDDDDYFDKLFESVKVYDPNEDIGIKDRRDRKQPAKLPPETRLFTFDEVEQVFSNTEAIAEAERCLRCYYVVTIAV